MIFIKHAQDGCLTSHMLQFANGFESQGRKENKNNTFYQNMLMFCKPCLSYTFQLYSPKGSHSIFEVNAQVLTYKEVHANPKLV